MRTVEPTITRKDATRTITASWERGTTDHEGDPEYVVLSVQSLHPQRKGYVATLRKEARGTWEYGTIQKFRLFEGVRIGSKGTPRYSKKDLQGFFEEALAEVERRRADGDPEVAKVFGDEAPRDPFADANIISTYTAEQAVEDGVLVDIREMGLSYRGAPIVRMTRTLYAEMEQYGVHHHEGLAAFIAKAMRTKLQYAVDTDGDGYIVKLPGGGDHSVGEPEGYGIWLVRDPDGYVAMVPSDY